MPWQTGDLPPGGDNVTRVLVIPRTVEMLSSVNGALLPLLNPLLWEQSGTLTPEQAALLMEIMYYNYLDSGS